MDLATFAAQAVEHLPIPFFVLEHVEDADGQHDLKVLWANALALARFGDGIVGSRLDRDAALGTTDPVASGHDGGRSSARIRVFERTAHRGGLAQHLRCTMVPTDDRVVTMLVEDITSEATTRAELAVASNTLARVERWGNLGVWEVDLVSRSVYWSTQVFEILGVTEPGLDQYLKVVHPDDLALIEHLLKRVTEQPGPYHVNHRIVRGEEVRTLDQHLQSVPDEHGRPVRLIGTMIDVTATHALAQQVHQNQRMRTLGLLAGGLAHDFNNVLMVVRGHADLLLRQSSEDDPIRPSLEAIAGAGERASNLTRKLMSLGRQEDLRPTLIAPFRFLTELTELVGPAVEADGVLLEVDGDEGDQPPELHADADHLSQVVIDLVLNARDAGATHVRLHYETRELVGGDPWLDEATLVPGTYGAIHVTDDGAGMDDATRRRIFEPFFTTKDASNGSGLGLANALSFAQRTSGGVVATSHPGAGTTMSLLLPVRGPSGSTHRSTRRGRGRVRLLVVAEADAHRQQLSGALARLGHQLVEVESFDEMEFSLATEPIDLVVADGELLSASARPVLDSVPSVVVDDSGAGDHVSYDDPEGLRATVEDLLGDR